MNIYQVETINHEYSTPLIETIYVGTDRNIAFEIAHEKHENDLSVYVYTWIDGEKKYIENL